VPTQAERLLERARRSPRDWSLSELRQLYQLFGFEIESRSKHYFAQHSQYPILLATIPRSRSVKVCYIRKAVELIDQLIILQVLEEENRGNS